MNPWLFLTLLVLASVVLGSIIGAVEDWWKRRRRG